MVLDSLGRQADSPKVGELQGVMTSVYGVGEYGGQNSDLAMVVSGACVKICSRAGGGAAYVHCAAGVWVSCAHTQSRPNRSDSSRLDSSFRSLYSVS
jgi:hypothetical protein